MRTKRQARLTGVAFINIHYHTIISTDDIIKICRARNGIGIILSKEWQDKILEIKRISDRIMTMKLVSGNTMLNIISVYAPQVGCSQQEKDSSMKIWRAKLDVSHCTKSSSLEVT